MELARWTPLRRIVSFRDEMDGLLDDFYNRMAPSEGSHEGDWMPAMDMKETDIPQTTGIRGGSSAGTVWSP